jgi:feruloyl esterase
MRTYIIPGVILTLFAAWGTTPAGAAQLAAVRPVVACESLVQADIDQAIGAKTHIESATPVHEGGGRSYCRVRGVVAPENRFEVQLPIDRWTQRFVQTGCGGLCGRLAIHLDKADTCKPAQTGELVLASTDMGHEGGMDGTWGRNDYQARIDFAYRGVHLTTLAAKALITRYYGHSARYSYFFGCSDGGREALMEAQRFPEDFNGIMAGAPAMNFTTQNSFYHGWNAVTNQRTDGSLILTAEKLPVLHRAVLEQCDAADGLRDGLISDPVHCHPDLSPITCRTGQDPSSCLTAEQVHVAMEIYRGAHDASGHGLVIDGPMPGSELEWVGVFVPPPGQSRSMSATISEGTIRNLDSDPNPPADFSLRDFRFDKANFVATTRLHGLYDSTDTDLTRFAKAGGHLILWHGLADPHISPMNTVAYYEAMRRVMGASTTDAFARLYLFPGGAHCAGGAGPFDFDLLSAMMNWVENAVAPVALIASHRGPPGSSGQGRPPIDRTRPVYPYPQVAQYVGHGSIDDAADFEAASGQPWPVNDAWYGADFFAGHEHLWCDAKGNHFECRAASLNPEATSKSPPRSVPDAGRAP